MKKKMYHCPAVSIDMAEPQNILAVSFNIDDVEWRDGVELEVKEDKVDDGSWDNIW